MIFHLIKKLFNSLKNILTFKKVHVGLGFLIGLLLGYLLGLLRVHIFLINILPNFSVNLSWLKWIGDINPNPTFLSEIAAFEAAIIAFLVPLSIDIISKLSERYNSNVINRSFEDNWGNKILPIFLLINIVGAIILRFIVADDINSLWWKISSWIMLLLFIYIAFEILRVINRIKKFMSNIESIVDELFKNAEKSI